MGLSQPCAEPLDPTTAFLQHALARRIADAEIGAEAEGRALNDRNAQQNNGFVTLVYGHLTPAGDGLAVELVRAGHTLPLLLDSGHTVTPVEAHGGLIGIGVPPRLDAVRFTLRPTESPVLYTDGITECRGENTEQYGDARLAKALASTPAHPSAAEIVRKLTEDIRAFTDGRRVDDDQAALVVTAEGP